MLKKNQKLLSPLTFFLLFEFVRRADHLHFLPAISTYNTVLMGKTLFNLSWQRALLYRNQPINLQKKSTDWFLFDRDLCHERVKGKNRDIRTKFLTCLKETLTHFIPVIHFYAPWKLPSKPLVFWFFQGGYGNVTWPEMGEYNNRKLLYLRLSGIYLFSFKYFLI